MVKYSEISNSGEPLPLFLMGQGLVVVPGIYQALQQWESFVRDVAEGEELSQ